MLKKYGYPPLKNLPFLATKYVKQTNQVFFSHFIHTCQTPIRPATIDITKNGKPPTRNNKKKSILARMSTLDEHLQARVYTEGIFDGTDNIDRWSLIAAPIPRF